jgi:hypothetical protein
MLHLGNATCYTCLYINAHFWRSKRNFSEYILSLEIMSFPSQKVVFSRFNRKKLLPSLRSRIRIFGASNSSIESGEKQDSIESGEEKNSTGGEEKQDSTEEGEEQLEIQDPVERWNCVLRVIDGETILVLLNPVDNKSLKEVWKWAKMNITMSYVRECLAANTKDNFPDDSNNRKYNIPEKMMLKMNTEEWQYFLIQEGTKFKTARIELEEVPREWGGFKLWKIPRDKNMISVEIVATWELQEQDVITEMLGKWKLEDIMAYQVMSYLEKTQIDNVNDIVVEICVSGIECEAIFPISEQKSLKATEQNPLEATEKSWMDYYKKRWISVKLENKVIWTRIDWRNERYYVSAVEDVNDKFKFIIQNQEIKRPDRLKYQPLENDKIKSIITELKNSDYWTLLHDQCMIEVKLTKAEHEKVEILKRICKVASENVDMKRLKIIRTDGTPLYFSLQDLRSKIEKFEMFQMWIPNMHRNSWLLVIERDNKLILEVAEPIKLEESDKQQESVMRVKNAVQAYMRREQGEYRRIDIIMNLESKNSKGDCIITRNPHPVPPRELTLDPEMDELMWEVTNLDVDGCKLTLKKILPIQMEKMKLTLTMEVEYPDLKSLGHLINPQQKVIVAETPKDITMSFIVKGDKYYQILKRVSTNTFRIRAKDNDGIEWDVISTGFGDSLKLKRKKRDNDGNHYVTVTWVAEDDDHSIMVKKYQEDLNGYRLKCIFMLVKVLFLLAIVVVSVFFYYKKEQMLNDEILSWYIFSSLAIITIGSMIYDYLFTETMNKTWTMLAHLSLLLGLFLLSLMYISYWPVSTYGIYLPFFIAPVFLTFHDTSAIPPYIKKLPMIAGIDGAEYYLPFVLIYRMALMTVVLLMASKLEDEFSVRWWTILIIFGTARSIYLILVWYSLWNYKIQNPNDNSLDSLRHIKVYTLLNILSHIAFMFFGMFASLILDEILD